MPHQCTTCGHVFPDGSKEMLSGCPDCGGNKFQFHAGELTGDAAAAADDTASSPGGPEDSAPAPSGDAGGDRSHLGRAVGKAADTVREFVADRARPERPEPPADAPARADGVRDGRSAADSGAGAGAATDAGPDPSETTQATLDSLAADDGADDAAAAATDAESTGAADAESAVAADQESPAAGEESVAERWPSVGTEDGVETDDRPDADEPGEWPDPWEAGEDDAGAGRDDASAGDDDLIVAGESSPAAAGGSSGEATATGDAGPAAEPGPGADAETSPGTDAGAAAETPQGTDAGATADTGPATTPTAGRDAEAVPADAADENRAQADARTSMVESEELPDAGGDRVVAEPDGDRPGLAELREELNDQFESIKVVAPGQYELNLMELYDREEYIIAIQENGRYVIEVPETIHGDAAE